MKNTFWRALAFILSLRPVANWLICRAMRTPYYPIMSRNGQWLYMNRWWLFNAYGKNQDGSVKPARFSWLPSIRVHHICLPDDDKHEHDHPWNARSIILRGSYIEERYTHGREPRIVKKGDTYSLQAGQFHRIASVSKGGVYTLFFTLEFVEEWGFAVDGKKVMWKTYLGE